MVRLGAVTGSAFDGGGSSSLAFDGQLLNRPSDPGGERPVSNALQLMYYGVYAPAPDPVISPNGDGFAETQRAALVQGRAPVERHRDPRRARRRPRLHRDASSASRGRTRSPSRPRRSISLAEPAPPAEGRWRLDVSATDDLARASTTTQTFAVNNTLGFAKLSRRSLVVRVRGKQTISAGVTLTRPARLTATVETKSGVQVATIAIRRAARRPVPGELERHDPRRQVPRLRRHVRGPLPRDERARRGRRRLPRRSASSARRRCRSRSPSPRGNLRAVPVASILSEITDAPHDRRRRLRPLRGLPADAGRRRLARRRARPVMVYGGAVAAGAFAGQDVQLFGWKLEPGLEAYLGIALAGTIGYTLGSILGWWIGLHGGRPFLERHGRWLHLNEAKLERAERWFERWEDWAVFLGRVTPVVRSFVSIPAGVFEAPLPALHRPDADRLGDLVLRPRRRRLGARPPLGGLPSRVPLRRLRDPRDDRGRGCISGLEAAAETRKARNGASLDSSGREDPPDRRQSAVRAADSAAEAGVRGRARERPVRLRAERRRLRARSRRLPGRPGGGRRRQRHRCPRDRARRDGHRAAGTR